VRYVLCIACAGMHVCVCGLCSECVCSSVRVWYLCICAECLGEVRVFLEMVRN